MDKDYAQYLLEKTRQDYNLIAEEFSRTREKPWPELQFLFDDFLTPGEKILDVGCGNGRFFEFCKEKNLDYSGIDSSEKLIEIAKNSYLHPPQVFAKQKFGRARAKFQVADALSLPFSSNHFDKVYSIAVLHHIPSNELRLKFLEGAKRVLKREGLLILTVWDLHRWRLIFKFTILKILGKSKLDFKDVFVSWGKSCQRYIHCFSKKELKNLIKKAGFKIKETGTLKMSEGKETNIYIIAQK